MFIRFNQVSFSYDGHSKNIIENLTLHFGNGFTGVVGANGCGKSTLAKLALGILKPDRGFVEYEKQDCVFAYCEQECFELPKNAYSMFNSESHFAGYIASIFKVDYSYIENFNRLSFGERKRMQIAAAMYQEPDILILDEPTNHIDFECLEILLNALQSYSGIGILISHDRRLLDSLVSYCLFIRGGVFTLRQGTFSNSLIQERLDIRHKLDLYETTKIKTKRLEKNYKSKREIASAKTSKSYTKKHIAKKDHDSKGKVDAARLSNKDKSGNRVVRNIALRLETSQGEANALYYKHKDALSINLVGALAKAERLFYEPSNEIHFGDGRILKYPEITIETSSRVGLSGYNGAGKTTLINHIIEGLSIESSRLLYIPQEISREKWNATLEEMELLDSKNLGFLISFVDRLGSDPKAILDSRSHSPGEIRKLQLAIGLLKRPYLLIMDEPTNHLDMPSIERLEEALSNFVGAFLLVSHDNVFLENLTKSIWVFNRESYGTSLKIKNNANFTLKE